MRRKVDVQSGPKSGFTISVITPSKNSARYLEEAIQSVITQDYPGFEHIIVDAVSTDGTLEILQRYPHLSWVSEPDKGQADAMNKGFAISTGDIVVYLNADDLLLPQAFKTVLPCFEAGADFVVGKVQVLLEDGSQWVNDPRVGRLDMLKHWEPDAFCVNPTGYYYRREVQERVGGFNAANDFAMDLEFLMAASARYTLTKVDALLGAFRFREGTKTMETMRFPDYWTTDNFAFVDKYLAGAPADFVREYGARRREGYRSRMRQSIEAAVHAAVEVAVVERENQIRGLQASLVEAERRAERLASLIDAYETSVSWRLTRPLRGLHSLISKGSAPRR